LVFFFFFFFFFDYIFIFIYIYFSGCFAIDVVCYEKKDKCKAFSGDGNLSLCNDPNNGISEGTY
jgi:hypothetical protein